MITKEEMIEKQLKDRGIEDPNVILAMWEVDRTKFVPEKYQEIAYEDGPLPIGKDQTISQPYIVAYMAQALELDPTDKVMEVGTGCGYNAAVLSRIVSHVYSVEIIEWLSQLAKENLSKTEFKNISVKYGDGYEGWPENAPFDKIILTASPPKIPEPLKNQLKTGGKLLAPVGRKVQNLILLNKTGENTFEEKKLHPVRFVPMTGMADH